MRDEPSSHPEGPYHALARLRAFRAFEKRHLAFIETLVDRDLVLAIGQREGQGKRLTLKEAFLLDISSIATVQRRLRRLRRLGAIQQQRRSADRRVVELGLSPKVLKALALYAELMGERNGGQGAPRRDERQPTLHD